VRLGLVRLGAVRLGTAWRGKAWRSKIIVPPHSSTRIIWLVLFGEPYGGYYISTPLEKLIDDLVGPSFVTEPADMRNVLRYLKEQKK